MKKNEATAEFLDALFDDSVTANSQIALWSKSSGKHQWCDSTEKAAMLANHDKNKDLYFSVGLYPEKVQRRTQDSVIGIPGVWLDIDVGDKENGRNYFPTMEDAIEWVYKDLVPHWSILVHSGGGLHVYLKFDEIFDTASESDHIAAKKMTRGFHKMASERCKYDLDPVVDLSRIMRLPGTKNTKAGQVCHVIEDSGRTISASELMEILPEVILNDTGQLAVPDEDVDFESIRSRLSLMREADATFRSTWDQKRRFKDRSPSSYCLSLANQLCTAGFSDAEVIASLKHWRSLNLHNPKPDSWYLATLSKARAAHTAERFEQKFDATIAKALQEIEQEKQTETEGSPSNSKTSSEPAQNAAVETVTTEIFGASLLKVVKVVVPDFHGQKERPGYQLVFEAGTINLENSAQLMNQGYMKQVLFDELGIIMKTMKSQKYDQILQVIAAKAETRVLPIESNTAYGIAGALEYMVDKKTEQAEIVDKIKIFEPHLLYKDENEKLWFHFDALKYVIAGRSDRAVDNQKVATILENLGSVPRRFGSRRLRLWLVPEIN